MRLRPSVLALVRRASASVRTRAFTLLELLIVVGLIGVLVGGDLLQSVTERLRAPPMRQQHGQHARRHERVECLTDNVRVAEQLGDGAAERGKGKRARQRRRRRVCVVAILGGVRGLQRQKFDFEQTRFNANTNTNHNHNPNQPPQ